MTINKIVNIDCLDYIKTCAPFHMAFADPPDGIGMKYNGFKDKFEDYGVFLHGFIEAATHKCEVLWLSLNSRYAALIGHIIHTSCPAGWEAKHCVQVFTFSQHNQHDLGDGHRIMYRLMKQGTKLYPDTVRIPSWRQLNGDKRADPRGKVPNNVFNIPRVTGNSKQRRKFFPTQLNELLYVRCIKLCCAPGSHVVDLFAGSGTLGRVGARCEVNTTMLEISRETCDNILKDQPDCEENKCL